MIKKIAKKIYVSYKMIFSSNVNEVIRAILKFFYFFLRKNFSRTKSIKNIKNTKTQPSKSTNSTKSTKSTKSNKKHKTQTSE